MVGVLKCESLVVRVMLHCLGSGVANIGVADTVNQAILLHLQVSDSYFSSIGPGMKIFGGSKIPFFQSQCQNGDAT